MAQEGCITKKAELQKQGHRRNKKGKHQNAHRKTNKTRACATCRNNIPFESAILAKMELRVVQQAQEILASELAINLKVTKVLDLLRKESYAYHQVLQPAQCLIHPANRGGLMCNPWDVHAKGWGILQVGPDMSKIRRSVAFEISSKDQVTKNAELARSTNLLPLPTGKERFCTVSSSHLVCFCRCVLYSTRTEHTELAAVCNNHLNLEALIAASGQPVGNPLETMVHKGWSWEVIKSDVEKALPELPHLLAQGLNTDAAVTQGCGEMEAMRSLAEVFTLASNTGSPSWPACVAQVKAARPVCHEYLDSVAYFAKHFGGGPGFPLVKLLESISNLELYKFAFIFSASQLCKHIFRVARMKCFSFDAMS